MVPLDSEPPPPMRLLYCLQCAVIVTLATAGVFSGIQKLSLSFILTEPPVIRCVINNTVNKSVIDSCEITEGTPCTSWDYEKAETAVSQFDLVCHNKFWIYLSQTIYLLGFVVGTFTSGVVADIYGRRPTIIVATLLSFIFSSAAVFSPSIVFFNILQFSTAASSISLYYVGYTYSMEIVPAQWKGFVTVMFGITMSCGYALTPLLAWLFPQWTHLQLVGTLPLLLIIIPISIPSFFTESPRWLLAKGLYARCEEGPVINNSIPSSENSLLLKKIKSANLPESSSKFFFESPGLCFSTIILFYIWSVFIIIYNFVIMNAKNIIPGDANINILVMAALDVVASFVTFPLIHYFDRHISTSMCLLITGVSFVFSSCVSDLIIKQALAQVGQFVNTICFNLMYLFTVEIYPTVVRSRAVGLLNGGGRIGSMIPPLLLPFVEDDQYFFSLGLMALVACGLIWLLPETKGVELMDTLKDGELFNAQLGGMKWFRKKEARNPKEEVKDDI